MAFKMRGMNFGAGTGSAAGMGTGSVDPRLREQGAFPKDDKDVEYNPNKRNPEDVDNPSTYTEDVKKPKVKAKAKKVDISKSKAKKAQKKLDKAKKLRDKAD